MKFTCDSCSAQYMISDEKVGATGVKVRCKKCGNVITVRRSSDSAEPAVVPPAVASEGSGDGLDAELGSAFDTAFGDHPPAADPDATQAMEAADAKRIADGPAPAPLSTEWYVAIGEAQVGPLPIADVKRKWEQGDVGPDSLCWRPGMGDWSPLSTVAELASILSPIPRPQRLGFRPRPSALRRPPRRRPPPRRMQRPTPPGSPPGRAPLLRSPARRSSPARHRPPSPPRRPRSRG
jgi:predicted Zn finger-like uncharacterized protein